MKYLILIGCLLFSGAVNSQIASTKTEQYKASFEKAIDISEFLDYEGPQIPIQILKCGINDEMYEMYPELKEKEWGLVWQISRWNILRISIDLSLQRIKQKLKIGWSSSSRLVKLGSRKTS